MNCYTERDEDLDVWETDVLYGTDICFDFLIPFLIEMWESLVLICWLLFYKKFKASVKIRTV